MAMTPKEPMSMTKEETATRIGGGFQQLFGYHVFNDRVMRERLPKDAYVRFKEIEAQGKSIDLQLADTIAEALKNWALEKGASHYTHWFQPLTGSTAEKHDSFLVPETDGSAIAIFSGKQLIKGEPDASSFPSGGLRSTFEARGYTVWDYTSPAFVKENPEGDVTLFIPTAFCSWSGEPLDQKTGLLRSMTAVQTHTLRVLRALGNTSSKRVFATVGPEQEYFLIDQRLYEQRLDLILTGRTLFGAAPPKGQEMEDHYFGSITDRVLTFMADLDRELWKLGVSAKTRHNEVSPAQYESAPIFAVVNIATDHNQLVMEMMRKVALRHELVCLLHEKPFAGVNGSGKHNNWSLATDDGINLLEPGDTPHDNEAFLVVLSALIKAVDVHADLLRAATANAGNDHRLGANEAPPAIISAFLGNELTDILINLSKGKAATSHGVKFLSVGVDHLPPLPKENSDRNRTSPFAFTGNKFEFRMMPSSMSIATANVVLNTIAAEALDEVATWLEKSKDVHKEAAVIIREFVSKHSRVIFNGNNYDDAWVREAKKRGLPNIASTVEALGALVTPKARKLFEKYGIYSHADIEARHEIGLETYCKLINIEAQTAAHMVNRQYIPAVIEFTTQLADSIKSLKAALPKASSEAQKSILLETSKLLASAKNKTVILEATAKKAKDVAVLQKRAEFYRDKVMKAMADLRSDIDQLERIVDQEMWPVPTYVDLLYRN